MTRIAIIGAGMAGVALAYTLKDHADIILIDKSRGVSGRIAHRRAGLFGFDHGAAYMTIRDSHFKNWLDPYISSGFLQNWPQRSVMLRSGEKPSPAPRKSDSFAISEKASSLVKKLLTDHLADLDTHLTTKVSQIRPVRDSTDGEWRVVIKNTSGETEQSELTVDWVISTAPAPQTEALIPPTADFHHELSGVEMDGCFTLMLGFDAILDIDWDAAWGMPDHPLGFIADNRTKPGRDKGRSALTVHAGNRWSAGRLDYDPEIVKQEMINALKTETGIDAAMASHVGFHRWLYANPSKPLGKPFLIDVPLRLAAAGDWCLGGRIENAYLSGSALGRAILPLI